MRSLYSLQSTAATVGETFEEVDQDAPAGGNLVRQTDIEPELAVAVEIDDVIGPTSGGRRLADEERHGFLRASRCDEMIRWWLGDGRVGVVRIVIWYTLPRVASERPFEAALEIAHQPIERTSHPPTPARRVCNCTANLCSVE